MFNGFSAAALDFLWDVRFYNDKQWLEQHKTEFRQLVQTPLRELAAQVSDELAVECRKHGLEPHVSRIYRDARRLHGHGPLKDHMWFSLRKPCEYEPSKPVFWFELKPEGASWGMGYYQATPTTMAKHRARLARSPRPLMALARRLSAQQQFVLDGQYYQHSKGHMPPPLDCWYDLRNFSLLHRQAPGEELFSPQLVARLVEDFHFLLPYYIYFLSLEDDAEPVRR